LADQPPFDKDNSPKNDGAEPRPKLSVTTGGPRVTPADPNAPRPAGPRPFTPGGGQNRSSNPGAPRPFTPGGGQNRPSGPGAPRPYTPGGGTGAPRPFTPGGAPRPFSPGGGGAAGGRPQRGRYVPREERLEHRINELIRIDEGRLVGDNLEELSTEVGQTIETGIFPISQLMAWAEKSGLDLVETVPNAQPPVVRIIDYNKFVYNKRKKEKELKANAAKTVLKEIRFGPNTDDHDFEFKTKHAREFLSKGDKVKAFVQFKGRAIVFKERGELLLLKFLKELEDVCTPEQLPKLEGRRMIVMLTPKKSGKK
jgi:translation initiation factor IF-3